MEKGYNGWNNYETWLFNLYHGDYLQESLEEMQEQGEILNYSDVLNHVNGHIDMLMEDMPQLDGFLSDMVGKGVQQVDIHEICEAIVGDLGITDIE